MNSISPDGVIANGRAVVRARVVTRRRAYLATDITAKVLHALYGRQEVITNDVVTASGVNYYRSYAVLNRCRDLGYVVSQIQPYGSRAVGWTLTSDGAEFLAAIAEPAHRIMIRAGLVHCLAENRWHETPPCKPSPLWTTP